MQTVDSSMTEAHDICQELVARYLPDELDVFELIWKGYWRAIGCNTLVEYADLEIAFVRRAGVRRLGAAGRGEISDSEELMAPILSVMAKLKKMGKNAAIEHQDIRALLNDAADEIEASDRNRGILDVEGTAMVARWYGLKEIGLDNLKIIPLSNFYVEWCETPESESENPGTSKDHLDRNEIRERFLNRIQHYQLFVDETRPCIHVNGSKTDYWPELGTKHKILLGMILPRLDQRGPLPWSKIVHEIWDRDSFKRSDERAVIQTLSELNAKLDGVLKNVVKSEGRQTYGLYRYIGYCWIRSNDKQSRLWRKR